MKIKSKKTTYNFQLKEIENMIIDSLGLEENQTAEVEFEMAEVGGDPMDRYPGVRQVVGVNVIVTSK